MDELNDSYKVFVPIEDDDLMKSISIDENGDYIVQGVMTSDAVDEEDDSITPEGMDCSYFLTKGWIKYEHGNKPEQFIGEPLEVKVGRFEHPTLMKAVNGIFVKGRLFAQRTLTKSAIEAMEDLQKSNTKRRMGWSIEGNVKERNKAGKIVKSVLRNVVLTMNPVNTTTWAELAKSFAKDHELDINMEDVNKSMDTASMAEVTPQSLEGAQSKKKDTDPQQDWITHFRDFVKKTLIKKSFRSTFIKSAEDAEILAFGEMLSKGLDMEEAEEFASYIAEKHKVLKSIITNFGGENMDKEKLSSLLDTDLEELQKSIEMDEEEFEGEEEEELSKSIDSEEDEGDGEGDSEEYEEDGDEDEEGDEDAKGGSNLRKSLAANGQEQAFEVSDFLTAIADEFGYGVEGIEKGIMGLTKQNSAIVKALGSFGEVLQKALTKIEDLEEQNQELNKSLSEVMNRPVGRKGVVNQREVQTLSKSVNSQPPTGQRLTKSAIVDKLVSSAVSGDIPYSAVSRFEAGVPLENLGLSTDYLQKSFGL